MSNLRLDEVILKGRPESTAGSYAGEHGTGWLVCRAGVSSSSITCRTCPEEVLRLQQSALTRDIPLIIVSADATPPQIARLLGEGQRPALPGR